jgi:hypothetical protein
VGMRHWALGVMIALNQLGNALTGGTPDSSVSNRLAEARDRGNEGARFACFLLEQVDFHPRMRVDHCDDAKRWHWVRVAQSMERLRLGQRSEGFVAEEDGF